MYSSYNTHYHTSAPDNDLYIIMFVCSLVELNAGIIILKSTYSGTSDKGHSQ